MDDPTFNKDLYGISLGDIAIIGLAHSDFILGNDVDPPQLNKGIGFTQVIIHESGHMIGLMHPHQYGSLGDFVSSAMSYYTWEYNFSQFDCDAVQRAQADQFIMEASSKVSETKAILADRLTSLELQDKLNSADDLLKNAQQQYATMNYIAAMQYAKSAALKSRETVANARSQVLALPVFTIIGIVIGIIIGYVGIPYFRKRKQASALTATQKTA
jgi:hypothetical protein